MKCNVIASGDVFSHSLTFFLKFTVILMLIVFTGRSNCEVYESLQWTPENPMFITNTTRCVDGQVPQMNVLPSSKIHIICPTPVTVLETVQSTKPKQNLFENLWIIYDNKSFETCNVNTSNAELIKKKNRQLMQCNKPLELKYFTIVFQPFSAVSGGLEFAPGKEYYFLATSDGTKGSLGDSAGGHCNDTKNYVSMKFKVYVCKDETDKLCKSGNFPLGTLDCNRVRPTTTTSTTQLPSKSTTQNTNSEARTTANSPSASPGTGDEKTSPGTGDGQSATDGPGVKTSKVELSSRIGEGKCKNWMTVSITLACVIIMGIVIGILCKICKLWKEVPDCRAPFVCCLKNNQKQVKNKEKTGDVSMYGVQSTATQGANNEAFDPDHSKDHDKDEELDKEKVSPVSNNYVNTIDETQTEKPQEDMNSHVYEAPPDAAKPTGETLLKVAEMRSSGKLAPLKVTSNGMKGPTDFHHLGTFGKNMGTSANFNERNV